MSKFLSVLPRLVTAGFFWLPPPQCHGLALLPEMAVVTAQAADMVMPNLCRLL